MEAVFFVVVASFLLALADLLLGRVTAKAVGLVGGVVAIALLSLVLFQPVGEYTAVTRPALVALILWWALVGAGSAGAYLYSHDEKGVGCLAGSASVVSLFVGLYFIIGDWSDPASISYWAGAVTLVLSVVSGVYWTTVYMPRLIPSKKVAGWITMLSGAAVGIIGLLALVGAIDLPA